MKNKLVAVRVAVAGVVFIVQGVSAGTIYALDDVITTSTSGPGRLVGWFEAAAMETDEVVIEAYRIRAMLDATEYEAAQVLYEWSSFQTEPYPSTVHADAYPSTGIVNILINQQLPLGSGDIVHNVFVNLAFNLNDYDILTNSIPLIPAPMGNADLTSYWLEMKGDHDYGAFGNVVSGSLLQGATAVPEPGTISLFGFGLLGVVIARRRASSTRPPN